MSTPELQKNLVLEVTKKLRELKPTVAVIGDVILDQAIEGEDGGMHADLRIPLLRNASTQESPGGAANIALALSKLGVRVALYGIIGGDLEGNQLQAMLDRQLEINYLVTQRGWPTPRKDWIYERRGSSIQLRQRIDYDRPLPGKAREELVGEFRARCPAQLDAVVLADHGLGSIASESLALVGLAKERRAKLVAIPRTRALHGQSLDALVLNAPEMRNLVEASQDDDVGPLAETYAQKYSQHIFLTLLNEGLLVCPANKAARTHCPGYKLENSQFMGVRDITAVAVVLGLVLGLEPTETGKLAVLFRHVVASQRGNGRILWRDVQKLVGLPEEG